MTTPASERMIDKTAKSPKCGPTTHRYGVSLFPSDHHAKPAHAAFVAATCAEKEGLI